MDLTLFLGFITLFFFGFSLLLISKGYNKSSVAMLLMCMICVAVFSLYKGNKELSDFYYYPCEIIAQNEQSTYFGGVDIKNAPIYFCETDPDWEVDTCYLLYMDSKGTPEREDDEILVVWRQ